MKSMKRNFWKKTAAGIMAVMILAGGVPKLDMPGLFEKSAITAKADNVTIHEVTTGSDLEYWVESGAYVKLMNDVTIERIPDPNREDWWNDPNASMMVVCVNSTIDLNGHCLYLKGSSAIFYIQEKNNNASLTVKDSSIDPNTYQPGQKIGAIIIDNSIENPADEVAFTQQGKFIHESGAILDPITMNLNTSRVKITSPYAYYSSINKQYNVSDSQISYTDKCSAPVGNLTSTITYGNGQTATLKHASVNSDYYFGKSSDGSAEKPYTIGN